MGLRHIVVALIFAAVAVGVEGQGRRGTNGILGNPLRGPVGGPTRIALRTAPLAVADPASQTPAGQASLVNRVRQAMGEPFDQWPAMAGAVESLLKARQVYAELAGPRPAEPATPTLAELRRAREALVTALETSAPAEVTQDALRDFLQACDAATKELVEAQQALQKLLTPRQEAALVAAGWLEDSPNVDRMRTDALAWSGALYQRVLGSIDEEWRILLPKFAALQRAALEVGQAILPEDVPLPPADWQNSLVHRARRDLAAAVAADAPDTRLLAERRQAYAIARMNGLADFVKCRTELRELLTKRQDAILRLLLTGTTFFVASDPGIPVPRSALEAMSRDLSASAEEWHVLEPLCFTLLSSLSLADELAGITRDPPATPALAAVREARSAVAAAARDPAAEAAAATRALEGLARAQAQARQDVRAAQRQFLEMLTKRQEAVLVAQGSLDPNWLPDRLPVTATGGGPPLDGLRQSLGSPAEDRWDALKPLAAEFQLALLEAGQGSGLAPAGQPQAWQDSACNRALRDLREAVANSAPTEMIDNLRIAYQTARQAAVRRVETARAALLEALTPVEQARCVMYYLELR